MFLYLVYILLCSLFNSEVIQWDYAARICVINILQCARKSCPSLINVYVICGFLKLLQFKLMKIELNCATVAAIVTFASLAIICLAGAVHAKFQTTVSTFTCQLLIQSTTFSFIKFLFNPEELLESLITCTH